MNEFICGLPTISSASPTACERKASDLLDRGANPNLADCKGGTPLREAAARGLGPIVQILLEAKADIDAVHPESGETAFHACQMKR